jgi:hypothetical protein
MLRTPDLNFVRVEAPQTGQLLELIHRSYAEFEQFLAAAEQQAVVEIASGEPLAKAWLIRGKGKLIGYCILSLTFSLRCGGRGAVLDQIYLTPAQRTYPDASSSYRIRRVSSRASWCKYAGHQIHVQRHTRARFIRARWFRKGTLIFEQTVKAVVNLLSSKSPERVT